MTGVSWDSVTDQATFASAGGTWSTDYPLSNLAEPRLATKVARVTPAGGGAALTFTLASSRLIQFIGLVRHNVFAEATLRVYLYDGDNNLLHDSDTMSFWPGGYANYGYPAIRPYVLPEQMAVRWGMIEMNGLPATVEIGSVEIAKWWSWVGLAPGKEFGFKTTGGITDLLGAGMEPPERGGARVLNGQISHLALEEAASIGLDFQRRQGQGRPFVYVQDYDDPFSWLRTAMYATNSELPPSVGVLYRHDTFQFRFTEYLR